MDIRVPEELQPILRDFTKAVLRDRPDDVLQYSRQYFIGKWSEERMANYTLPPSTSTAFADLAEPLKKAAESVFKRFDTDCDGELTIEELHEMVGSTNAAFGLASDVGDTVNLLKILDVDNNFTVSWQEWSHACSVWLHDLGV